VRVGGENQSGIAGKITDKLARGGINLRGFSGVVVGKHFVLNLAFDVRLQEKANQVIKGIS
jgi:predicted amino acid-binding ACT domain protein